MRCERAPASKHVTSNFYRCCCFATHAPPTHERPLPWACYAAPLRRARVSPRTARAGMDAGGGEGGGVRLAVLRSFGASALATLLVAVVLAGAP